MPEPQATVAWVPRVLIALLAPLGLASTGGATPGAVLDERAEMVEWFRGQVREIDSLDPEADRSDLEALRQMVGDARIVGLGEATHGTSDFFRMKHRIVRFLVEEMGFTHFAIEAGFAEGLALGEYVAKGTGDAKTALADLGFWTWNTEEVLAMVEWMRSLNAAQDGGPRIQFYGCDMQSPVVAASRLLAYLDEVDFEFAEGDWSFAAEVRKFLETAAAGGRQSIRPVDVAARQEMLEILRERFEDFGEDYAAESSATALAHALQLITVMGQSFEGTQDRDRCMAENTSWLLDQAGPDGKVIVWAHNGHVARNGLGMLSVSQGKVLHERHGEDYRAFGFAFNEGGFQSMTPGGGGIQAFTVGPNVPESLDAILAEAGPQRAFYDLRAAQAGSTAHRWLVKPQKLRAVGGVYSADMEKNGRGFMVSAPAGAFDVLIFADKTRRATPVGMKDGLDSD